MPLTGPRVFHRQVYQADLQSMDKDRGLRTQTGTLVAVELYCSARQGLEKLVTIVFRLKLRSCYKEMLD